MGMTIHVGVLLFTFFVLAPFIAAMIGYAAWKGKPKSFDREIYWTVFTAAMAAALILMVYVQRHADSLPGPVVFAGLILGGVLFGVSMGFGVGVFTRKKSTLPPFDSRN
jgi:hypothetical protein